MSGDTRVWIAQCLCPGRHCLLASAGEAETKEEATESLVPQLREAVSAGLASGEFNPWCAICRAVPATWRYEVGRTRFRTMAEAMPVLELEQWKQMVTNALFGDTPRSD